MTLLTNNSKPLTPAEITGLVIEPVLERAVTASAANVIPFSTNELRIPIVTDGSAAWVAEGAEIPVDEPVLSEVVLTPRKLAVLVPLSNELIADANGDVTRRVGEAVARAIARKLDAAFFAATTPANGMKALGAQTGTLTATSDLVNLDVFVQAISDLAAHGNQASTIVVSPATFKVLATLKVSAGSNAGLLQPTATLSTPLQIAGLPVVVTSALADDVAYVVDSSRIIVGLRTSDVQLAVDSSVYFSSDRSALRATLRVGSAFPDPTAIVSITLT